jgi:hypothetical protein
VPIRQDEPLVVRADRIRSYYRAHLCSRDAAIAQIFEAFDGRLTEAGAAELLDHELAPSQRYARAARRTAPHEH